ncbi:unnamed protein product [Cylindrotheca closterium]|uniref:Uncharacterized protein n=1 Tax=Cylindrotheca closterium TaxID=2856 RepID=A0AAD2CLH9_9STRA|nr:unnamed protein product [Cylindrotheca closterium]
MKFSSLSNTFLLSPEAARETAAQTEEFEHFERIEDKRPESRTPRNSSVYPPTFERRTRLLHTGLPPASSEPPKSLRQETDQAILKPIKEIESSQKKMSHEIN